MRFLPTRWWSVRAWRTWWTYVYWRMETYGVFFPQGRLNWTALGMLVKQMPSYQKWLAEFDRLRSSSPKAIYSPAPKSSRSGPPS